MFFRINNDGFPKPFPLMKMLCIFCDIEFEFLNLIYLKVRHPSVTIIILSGPHIAQKLRYATVGFEVLTAVTMKCTISWVVTPRRSAKFTSVP
jgi:hypothetical protein